MKSIFFTIILILLSIGTANAQVEFIFGKQFGTGEDDKTRNVVIDSSGNIFVLGKTRGMIGKENYGQNDAFIVKIDSNANTVWSVQIGSTADDEFKHATTDKSGKIYTVGYIGVDKNNAEDVKEDVLVVKLDSSGEIVWKKQFGTDSSDIGENIAVDTNGEIYLIGTTKGKMGDQVYGQIDCFILHLDKNGDKLDVAQFGTSGNDLLAGINIGYDSRIYVCGSTDGNIAANNKGKIDLFWGSFSKDLKQEEMRQYGTGEGDFAGEIRTDNHNNVYIAGCTYGSAAGQQKGNGDALLQKWNDNGEILWTKQFGTGNWDGMHSIALLQDKGVVVSGCYDYPLCKSFVKMYDDNGTLVWKRNIVAQGKGGGSCGKDVCVSQQGYVYHAGYTGANLFSDLKGEHDLFLVKLKAEIKE